MIAFFFSVRLRVNDKEVGEKQTLDDESPIGTTASQMFIGGFAERSKPPNNEIPITVPLIGCVSDIYHNYKKIPIVPEEHSAEIGTCAIESPSFASPIDEPLDPETYKHHRKDSRLSHQLDRNFYELLPHSPIHTRMKFISFQTQRSLSARFIRSPLRKQRKCVVEDSLQPYEMAKELFGLASPKAPTVVLISKGNCIQTFRSKCFVEEELVNGAVQNLEGESSRDVIPCAQPTKGMYAHEGKDYAVFDGVQKSIKDGSRNIDITLSFRPIVDEGTILALLSNSNPEAARLTLELKQDKVLVTVIHAASDLEIRDAIPALRPLCDGAWHSLHLSIGDKIMQIKIDEERNELPVNHMSSDARELFLNLPVNVAGVSAPVAEKLSTTSLMGCYRELRFAGHPKYFENAPKQNKIAVDGCPFQ
ncbi:laminin G domain protein [Cooperia oncophora]